MENEIGFIWLKKQFNDVGCIYDALEILEIVYVKKNNSCITICSGNFIGQELPTLENYQETDEIIVSTIDDFHYFSFLSYLINDNKIDDSISIIKELSFFITENPRKIMYFYIGPIHLRVKELFYENKNLKVEISIKNDNISKIKEQSNIENNELLSINIEDICNKLKESIYGQDEALKKILVCIKKNFDLVNRNYGKDFISELKSTLLLCGPTGCGKTLIITKMAKFFNIPYFIEDATRYTRAGYVGENVENMLLNLYDSSDKILKRAETGILFIDEFDKICQEIDYNSDISTTAVQKSLLKILEGTKIPITRKYGDDPITFDTSRLTIVLAGAFDKIKSYSRQSLKKYGLISEIAGRTTIVQLNSPSIEDLYNAALYSKNSYLVLLKRYLMDSGITLEYSHQFVHMLSEIAFSYNEGYRGIKNVMEDIYPDIMYDMLQRNERVLKLTPDYLKSQIASN